MCGGHGHCDGGDCLCDAGWTGSDCTTPPSECPVCVHGTCNRLQKRCECESGWNGDDCSMDDAAAAAAAAAKGGGEDGGAAGAKGGDDSPPGSKTLQAIPEELAMGSEEARQARLRAAREAARRKAEAARKKAIEEAKKHCGPDDACSGHGTCNTTLDICECVDNWDGAFCDYEHCGGYNETAGIEDCNGHGTCEEGMCSCAPGWGTPDEHTGVALLDLGRDETCAERVCPIACGLHGRCVESECVCDEGFTGNTCHKPACPKDCSGHGTCAFWSGSNSPGECECFPGFEGGDCARPTKTMRQCPNNCNGNGLCLNGRCMCSDGFRGSDCGDAVCSDPQRLGPECNVQRCPNDCQGQGLCFSGTCDCWQGFFGDDCGIPRDCMQGCGHLCEHDSRTPHCTSCLGDCETLLAGNHLGKHAWTVDVHT